MWINIRRLNLLISKINKYYILLLVTSFWEVTAKWIDVLNFTRQTYFSKPFQQFLSFIPKWYSINSHDLKAKIFLQLHFIGQCLRIPLITCFMLLKSLTCWSLNNRGLLLEYWHVRHICISDTNGFSHPNLQSIRNLNVNLCCTLILHIHVYRIGKRTNY